ncbi:hypothetical protein ACOSP7_006653 [Xanthoceras sorbifolium]
MDSNSSTTSSVQSADQMVTPSSTDYAALAKSINFNIPTKLDRENYVYWKAQVLPAIEAFKLDDFISGIKPIPAKYVEVETENEKKQTVMNKKYVSWRKANKLLVCWLLSTVSPSIIGEVTSCNTACELWNMLKSLYSQQSLAKVLQLRQQLQTVVKGSSSISEFVLKVRNICDAIRGAGDIVRDLDLLLSILNGVGHEYYPVAVLIANKKQTMTIQEA